MLIVLDNVRDAEQVRPLLPGSPTCLVLVTSRSQLASLIAVDGAHPLTLDVLTVDESRRLLARRLGIDRIASEPEATDAIIARCARLPLALAIVAARAATRPDFPLDALASELRLSRDRLDAIAGSDPATDLRAVFSWSCRTLTPAAMRLFRLLGLHPGEDISPATVASLAGLGPTQVRSLLAELARGHLIDERVPGRYSFHDLLHAYAAEQAHAADLDDERRTAVHRLLDHYLHTALAADRLLAPGRDPIDTCPTQPGVIEETLDTRTKALGWFMVEHRTLLAAIDLAALTGHDTHSWQLAWSLSIFLEMRGHWHDWAATQQAALAAARRLADPAAQAHAHRILARAHIRLGNTSQAENHLDRALDLHGHTGNLTGQARTYVDLGDVRANQGRITDALDVNRQALALFGAASHRGGQAYALNNMGWFQAHLGDHGHALDSCTLALTLHEELGDRIGQAATWDSLGYAHRSLGDLAQAVSCYQRSVQLYRELGDRYEEATSLTNLGDTQDTAHQRAAARKAWQSALTILTDLDHPDADTVRDRLQLSC